MSILSNIIEAPMPRTIKTAVEYPAGPRKVAPLHPGAVLGDIITDIGLSIRSVAGDLGVSHNALANSRQLQQDPTPGHAHSAEFAQHDQ